MVAFGYRHILIILSLIITMGKAIAQDYQFERTMSRPMLESYLKRSVVTELDSLHRGIKAYDDVINFCAKNDIRILCSCYGVGYGSELPLNYGEFDSIANFVQDVNKAYQLNGYVAPLVNTAIWEVVTRAVDSIWMDSTVAQEYNVPIRRFIFDSLKYPGDTSTLSCSPDISRRETQMYFFYLAHRFIDCGIEDIHFGQINLENKNDAGNVNSWNLYSRIRRYGAAHNRGLVLLNGDSYGLYLQGTDSLLYDYHTAPSRVSGYYTGSDSTWTSMWDFNQSTIGGPGQLSYNDCSAYGKMMGGQTCLGWYADTLPYQVALDNTITNLCNCLTSSGCWTAYGYDEISWFVLQSKEYRDQWLCYANGRVKALDPNCYFVMPIRTLFTRHWWYYVGLNGYGFDEENTIVSILNGVPTDCDPNDVLDLHAIYANGQADPTEVIAYPNPASGDVTIVFHTVRQSKAIIRINDMTGREVISWKTEENQGDLTWSPGELQSGVYSCTISSDKGPTTTTKITLIK